MQLSDFHFTLPNELIARYPAPVRSASRLFCLYEANEHFLHRQFSDLVDLVNEGDLLIFNNTKVIPAKVFGEKTTGGRVEMLVERVLDAKRVLAQLRVSKKPHAGDILLFGSQYHFKVLEVQPPFFQLALVDSLDTVLHVLDTIGQIPLPPYLHRLAEEADKERYQTVYAKHQGSVAAPTAGFHFDEPLLQQLKNKSVERGELTLHIGAGTFHPIRVERIADHQMHAEYVEISTNLCEKIAACQARGKRVIAVGTTTLRALESASLTGQVCPFSGETRIFIYPGHTFHCADVLITNFHLPQSTLLMLVAAFGGHQKIMSAYREAVKRSYRFYSYGDAMWIEKAD